jgi:molybdopterin converting factor small subunit
MSVRIRFYSGFEIQLPKDFNKEMNLNLGPGEDIASILKRFLPEASLGFVGMVLVNKKIVNFDYKAKDRDLIEVFPIIGGG